MKKTRDMCLDKLEAEVDTLLDFLSWDAFRLINKVEGYCDGVRAEPRSRQVG